VGYKSSKAVNLQLLGRWHSVSDIVYAQTDNPVSCIMFFFVFRASCR